jgi:hypothetical protein
MQEQRVFISYCHLDKDWLETLETHLKPYLRSGSVKSWSDQEIIPGSKWFEEIRAALTNTKVAVLLVTPDFLASDFIHEHELGPLLKEAEQGGVKILWVPVRASAYKRTALKDYQAVLEASKPLAGMTEAERDQAWVKICEKIEKTVNPSKPAPAIPAPPRSQRPSPTGQHPHRRNILFVISGILVVMIVASVILVSVLRNMDHRKVPVANVSVANEVKIGDEIFLCSRQGSYVITAMQISQINWPRLGNKDKAEKLTLLGDGPLRNGSVVQIQSLEQNLKGNNVLGVFADNLDNLNCYYSDDKKQDWIIHKRSASDPVLHYGDRVYLENGHYPNKLLTQKAQNAEFLTLDEGVDWWWVLEKVF